MTQMVAVAGAVQQFGADLVAIGSHGRSDLGALFLGSVSHAVATGVEAPVLVLRASSTASPEPRMLLVAIDGSAGSNQAVADAAQLASTFDAQVLVHHVRLLVATQGAAIVEPEKQARADVSRAIAAIKAQGIKVTGETVV